MALFLGAGVSCPSAYTLDKEDCSVQRTGCILIEEGDEPMESKQTTTAWNQRAGSPTATTSAFFRWRSTLAQSLHSNCSQFKEFFCSLLQPFPPKGIKKTFFSPLKSFLQKLNRESFKSSKGWDSLFLLLFEVLTCLKICVNLPAVQLCCDLFHIKGPPWSCTPAALVPSVKAMRFCLSLRELLMLFYTFTARIS